MKTLLTAVVLFFFTGCMAPRVPQSAIPTLFGVAKLPKDMDIQIEDLKYFRDTNGVVTLTAKSIRSRSRNNPAVIDSSTEQVAANWNGMKNLVEGGIKTGIETSAKVAKP